MKTSEIKTLDDAVKLLRQELNLDLTEKRFGFDFTASAKLRYEDEKAPLHAHHKIDICDFYKDGRLYSTLTVDTDPDWQMLNSAAYFGYYPNINGRMIQMGVNIMQPRTSKNPDVPFGRADSHGIVFLGVGLDAEIVLAGLAAIFIPTNRNYQG